ncbi:MAG: DUF1269 domain-containing protein [Lachnospiraceae bacterium]|nr:DUF1269 domain-containing protein [Lachnospiraceae bacterium]
MENIIMATFSVESEAYQAFSELKRDLSGTSFLVSQAVLVKKERNELTTCESFDTGIESTDDTMTGGLIGSFVGILGGPLGVLLGAGIGGLAGAVADSGDIAKNGSMLEKVSANLTDGTVAILALAQEEGNIAIDSKFEKYNAAITRYDAAEIQSELDAAKKTQKEMEKQARTALRQEKADKSKAKYEEIRAKIAENFDTLKKERNK